MTAAQVSGTLAPMPMASGMTTGNAMSMRLQLRLMAASEMLKSTNSRTGRKAGLTLVCAMETR